MAVGSISEKRQSPPSTVKETSSPAPAPNTVTPARAETPKPSVPGDRFVATSAPVARGGEAAPPQPAGRTEAEALQAADTILRGEALNTVQQNGATLVHDAPDVNDASDTQSTSWRHQQAQTEVERNRGLEKQKLAELMPADQARYEAVQQQLQAANDPVAGLALQKLLLEGKLPGGKDLAGEGSLLGNLSRLADPNTPLAQGIDRGQLLSDVVQEMAVPSAIAQHQKNTCGPTMASIHLAHHNPAEYVRLATGLASPEGKVKMAGGDTLSRVKDTASDDGSHRSVSQRLMEPAFMDYANGRLGYNNAKDVHTVLGIPTVPGAAPMMIDKLLEGVYGRDFNHRGFVFKLDGSKGNAMDRIREETASGQPVPAMMSFGDNALTSLHWVLVTGTKNVGGQEQISYVNPWGREETMPRAEFEGRLRGLNWDPTTPAAPASVSPEQLEQQRRRNGLVG